MDFDSMITPSVKKLILSDLDFVEKIQTTSETPFHHTVFGGYGGAVYSRWFGQRINKFGGVYEGGRNSLASFMSGYPAELFVTLDYFSDENIPQMGRISIYFHEARHAEGGYTPNHPHVMCPKNFKDKNGNEIVGRFTKIKIAGRAGCDSDPMGSYGISLIMMRNIAMYCQNCNQMEKAQAQLYAEDYFQRIANENGSVFKARNELKNDLGME